MISLGQATTTPIRVDVVVAGLKGLGRKPILHKGVAQPDHWALNAGVADTFSIRIVHHSRVLKSRDAFHLHTQRTVHYVQSRGLEKG